MKSKVISKRAMLAAAALLAFFAGNATAKTTLMRVDIPFPFLAGNTVLPADQYIVTIRSEAQEVELRSAKSTRVVYISASAFRPSAESVNGVLLFHTYGKVHILRKIWSLGESRGVMLPRPAAERELMAQVRSAETELAAGPAWSR